LFWFLNYRSLTAFLGIINKILASNKDILLPLDILLSTPLRKEFVSLHSLGFEFTLSSSANFGAWRNKCLFFAWEKLWNLFGFVDKDFTLDFLVILTIFWIWLRFCSSLCLYKNVYSKSFSSSTSSNLTLDTPFVFLFAFSIGSSNSIHGMIFCVWKSSLVTVGIRQLLLLLLESNFFNLATLNQLWLDEDEEEEL